MDARECVGCDGRGTWETECCNGADGCDCRGDRVDIGPCLVCKGTGVMTDASDPQANIKSIQGQCFVGSGPKTGFWAGR